MPIPSDLSKALPDFIVRLCAFVFDLMAERGRTLPDFVQKVFEDYLTYGMLE